LDARFSKVRSKYITFLGSDAFFRDERVIRKAREDSIDDEVKRLFSEAYMSRLKSLGYVYTDLRKVEH
jgi:hypothetical protein